LLEGGVDLLDRPRQRRAQPDAATAVLEQGEELTRLDVVALVAARHHLDFTQETLAKSSMPARTARPLLSLTHVWPWWKSTPMGTVTPCTVRVLESATLPKAYTQGADGQDGRHHQEAELQGEPHYREEREEG